jgi:hypothetical protein
MNLFNLTIKVRMKEIREIILENRIKLLVEEWGCWEWCEEEN